MESHKIPLFQTTNQILVILLGKWPLNIVTLGHPQVTMIVSILSHGRKIMTWMIWVNGGFVKWGTMVYKGNSNLGVPPF